MVDGRAIRVFTTRIDTVYGATVLVLAPDHPMVASLTTPARRAEVEAFAARMAAMGKIERTAEGAPKEGVFTGRHAINPFTGHPVPIWVANFVLSDYGTGALMAVPAHDSRDFAFARTYGLPIKQVIRPDDGRDLGPVETWTDSFNDDGILVDSGEYSGLPSAEARSRMGRGARAARARQADGHLPPEGLGVQPTALLGHAHPHRLLRAVRPRAEGHPGPGRPAPGPPSGHRHPGGAHREG